MSVQYNSDGNDNNNTKKIRENVRTEKKKNTSTFSRGRGNNARSKTRDDGQNLEKRNKENNNKAKGKVSSTQRNDK